MTVCTACGNNAPDDMRHCSQCGARLPDPEPEAPGKTGHFGDQDIKNLMSRMEREQAAPVDDGNLLAGLPRPKVGSMLSPLRGGQTSPAARKPEKRARSASGSTVMGMPLFSTGEQRAVAVPRPRAHTPAADEPGLDIAAGVVGGPSIQSLDSFKDDVNTAPDPAASVAPDPDSAADGEAAASVDPSTDARAASGPAERAEPTAEPDGGPSAGDLPDRPRPGALDVTSPTRPTEQAPAVGSGGPNIAVAVIVVAAAVAAVAFFLLK